MSRTPTGRNRLNKDDGVDSSLDLRRVSTSRDIRPTMATDTRPPALHRSFSSTLHHGRDYVTGTRGLFSSRSSNNSNVNLLPSQQKIEEERNPKYNPDAFYPAKIGEILNGRYRIVAKLGYGMTATVWLARDNMA